MKHWPKAADRSSRNLCMNVPMFMCVCSCVLRWVEVWNAKRRNNNTPDTHVRVINQHATVSSQRPTNTEDGLPTASTWALARVTISAVVVVHVTAWTVWSAKRCGVAHDLYIGITVALSKVSQAFAWLRRSCICLLCLWVVRYPHAVRSYMPLTKYISTYIPTWVCENIYRTYMGFVSFTSSNGGCVSAAKK